ncbi:hypothetical protein [Phascolarctobacterium sp.]|uniref:hypothetical protein n=1 Tax=Phascolarctobacterium sp. TaxID=2049039 RepID=UPI003062DDAA
MLVSTGCYFWKGVLLIILLKRVMTVLVEKWQIEKQEVIDVRVVIDHMEAFVQSVKSERYSKRKCQLMAEKSIIRLTNNRKLFLKADIDNNIADAIAEKYTKCFVELLGKVDVLLRNQLGDVFCEARSIEIKLGNDIKFCKKKGLYITNMQTIVKQYINAKILRCHDYAALINKDDIKIVYIEEVLPLPSNAIIRWQRKSFGRYSKWHYYIDDDKLLRDYTICKAVCDDFYKTGYIQALAEEFRQQLIKKIGNYFKEGCE